MKNDVEPFTHSILMVKIYNITLTGIKKYGINSAYNKNMDTENPQRREQNKLTATRFPDGLLGRDPRQVDRESPLGRISRNLTFLYGDEQGVQTFNMLQEMMQEGRSKIPKRDARPGNEIFGQSDIAIITFPDAFQRRGESGELSEPPLQTLRRFLTDHAGDVVNTVHVLPFNPSNADRGFSPINYSIVDPRFGDWRDIVDIGEDYAVMADLVVGHRSTKSEEFQNFLAGDPEYQDFFIWYKPEEIDESMEAKLKMIRRPRVHDVLTDFETADKREVKVWTTFSSDQVDVNYKNPQVLLNMARIMLENLQQGVNVLRIDALTYVWKELGTDCASLPQVHTLLQIFRDVLDEVSPQSKIISETNVPHEENISYFGTGDNVGHESHMVYNFALPPLVLDAFSTGNSQHLSTWAASLEPPSPTHTAFFNFLGSHDGIGVMGVKGILPEESFNQLPKQFEDRGGVVSYKTLRDGGRAPYELNSTWWSAINNPDVDFDIGLRKFITSHAISFALQGVPAVYYHSLFGSENDLDTWDKTQVNRDINEKKLDYDDLTSKLDQPDSREARVFGAMKELISLRKAHQVFHPSSRQEVLDVDPRVFALQRGERAEENILAYHNVSKEEVTFDYAGKTYTLEPFGYLWESVSTTQDGTIERDVYPAI